MQDSPKYDQQLLPHLFRTEYTKLTAVLSRLFGLANIETAEDIASETFLSATEIWGHKGVPANPTAWLYTVAKNKTLDHLKRNQNFKNKIKTNWINTHTETTEQLPDFTTKYIEDSVLEMMFAVCNPVIPIEAQVSLALQILCGFSVQEIANAFVTSRETVKKRLLRARKKLRSENVTLQAPAKNEIDKRLRPVITTLYLLFNEGYFSQTNNNIIRKDVCSEAMRLTFFLTETALTNTPAVNALLALMCFQSSRLEARMNEHGEAILYEEQDHELWNKALIEKGNYFLNRSATGNEITKYHLEASIAYWHTTEAGSNSKWPQILQLYNQLLLAEYSPVAALNRAYAFSKVYGTKAAITEAEKLNMNANYFYHSLLGELYAEINLMKAIEHLQKAIELTASVTDTVLLQQKLDKLIKNSC